MDLYLFKDVDIPSETNMCLQRNFLGVLTLQVGVAVLAAIYVVYCYFMVSVNVFDYISDSNKGFPLTIQLLAAAVLLIILSSGLLIAGAYFESAKLILCGFATVLTLTVYYIVLTVISINSNLEDIRHVCIGNRCPETLWLWGWYKFPMEETWNEEQLVYTFSTEKTYTNEAPKTIPTKQIKTTYFDKTTMAPTKEMETTAFHKKTPPVTIPTTELTTTASHKKIPSVITPTTELTSTSSHKKTPPVTIPTTELTTTASHKKIPSVITPTTELTSTASHKNTPSVTTTTTTLTTEILTTTATGTTDNSDY